MKKTAILIAIASAVYGNNTIIERLNCDNGVKGFEVNVESEKIEKSVRYNSCIDRDITVLDSSGKPINEIEEGDRISFDGTEYYFPNGFDGNTNTTISNKQERYNLAFLDEIPKEISNYYKITGLTQFDWMTDLAEVEILSNLVETENDLYLHEANSLTSINGLRNLLKVGGSFTLRGIHKLENLDGLENLTEVGSSLILNGAYKLTNINGLSNLKKAHNISIAEAHELKDLDGFKKLESVGNNLLIRNINKLTNLNGLSSLTYVGGDVEITSGESLTDVSGLSNIENLRYLKLKNKDYEVKMKADSWLCNAGSNRLRDENGYAISKENVCET